jgi:O-acetylserine/cysteine efflux transporter
VLAALFLRERATQGQWLGLAVAMVGVVLIARSVEGSASLFAVGIALLSALSWAAGNLFLRETRAGSVLSSRPGPVSCRPVAAAVGEPDARRHDGNACADSCADAARLVRAFLYRRAGDVAGLPDGGTLLRSYPAGKVGPVSLLVPCCALVFSSLLTGESVEGLRLVGVAVVLGGVAWGFSRSGRR